MITQDTEPFSRHQWEASLRSMAIIDTSPVAQLNNGPLSNIETIFAKCCTTNFDNIQSLNKKLGWFVEREIYPTIHRSSWNWLNDLLNVINVEERSCFHQRSPLVAVLCLQIHNSTLGAQAWLFERILFHCKGKINSFCLLHAIRTSFFIFVSSKAYNTLKFFNNVQYNNKYKG